MSKQDQAVPMIADCPQHKCDFTEVLSSGNTSTSYHKPEINSVGGCVGHSRALTNIRPAILVG